MTDIRIGQPAARLLSDREPAALTHGQRDGALTHGQASMLIHHGYRPAQLIAAANEVPSNALVLDGEPLLLDGEFILV